MNSAKLVNPAMMLVMVMIDDDDDGDDVDDLPHCIIIIIVIGIADYRESGGGSLSISGEGRPLLSAINSPLRVIVIAVIIVSIVNIVNIYSIDSIIKNGTLSPLKANVILSKIKNGGVYPCPDFLAPFFFAK